MLQNSLDKLCQAISGFQKDSDFFSAGSIEPYQVNYLYNHLDSLQNKFRACELFLSANNFKFFARQFLLENPPSTPNIDLFGLTFPEFLETRKELEEYAYIGDIARIDLLWSGLKKQQITAKGVLSLWQDLIEDRGNDDIEIDTQLSVKVKLVHDNGETYLVEEAESSS